MNIEGLQGSDRSVRSPVEGMASLLVARVGV